MVNTRTCPICQEEARRLYYIGERKDATGVTNYCYVNYYVKGCEKDECFRILNNIATREIQDVSNAIACGPYILYQLDSHIATLAQHLIIEYEQDKADAHVPMRHM